MGLFKAFYIQTNNLEEVIKVLKSLMGEENQVNIQIQRKPRLSKYDTFSRDVPNYLLVGQLQTNWISIMYNNLCKIENWGKEISQIFNTHLVVVIYDSSSSYSYLCIYESGERVREIEVVLKRDDKIEIINHGKKFNFESEDENYKIEIGFDLDEMVKFASELDLDIFSYDEEMDWIVLHKKTKDKTMDEIAKEFNRLIKPWWKFW